MYRCAKIRIADLNPHIMCVLCGGYFIDATTVIECLHSFCRTCIVRYLESSKFCPICDVQVHKTRPLLNIRADKTLQDLVYKLVPGLFEEEMRRRREFHKQHPEEKVNHMSLEERGLAQLVTAHRLADESISLVLELSPNGMLSHEADKGSSGLNKAGDRRYLLCPADVSIGHLKKFIRLKFTLPEHFQIDMYHTHADEPLTDDFTLLDITFIHPWKRKKPLQLFYTVYERVDRKRRVTSKLMPDPHLVLKKKARVETIVANGPTNSTVSSTIVTSAPTPVSVKTETENEHIVSIVLNPLLIGTAKPDSKPDTKSAPIADSKPDAKSLSAADKNVSKDISQDPKPGAKNGISTVNTVDTGSTVKNKIKDVKRSGASKRKGAKPSIRGKLHLASLVSTSAGEGQAASPKKQGGSRSNSRTASPKPSSSGRPSRTASPVVNSIPIGENITVDVTVGASTSSSSEISSDVTSPGADDRAAISEIPGDFESGSHVCNVAAFEPRQLADTKPPSPAAQSYAKSTVQDQPKVAAQIQNKGGGAPHRKSDVTTKGKTNGNATHSLNRTNVSARR